MEYYAKQAESKFVAACVVLMSSEPGDVVLSDLLAFATYVEEHATAVADLIMVARSVLCGFRAYLASEHGATLNEMVVACGKQCVLGEKLSDLTMFNEMVSNPYSFSSKKKDEYDALHAHWRLAREQIARLVMESPHVDVGKIRAFVEARSVNKPRAAYGAIVEAIGKHAADLTQASSFDDLIALLNNAKAQLVEQQQSSAFCKD